MIGFYSFCNRGVLESLYPQYQGNGRFHYYTHPGQDNIVDKSLPKYRRVTRIPLMYQAADKLLEDQNECTSEKKLLITE